MKITRSRAHQFSMAPYESLKIEASTEFEVDDDAGEDDIAAASADADAILNELLAPDIERAAAATRAGGNDTYLHAWKDEL